MSAPDGGDGQRVVAKVIGAVFILTVWTLGLSGTCSQTKTTGADGATPAMRPIVSPAVPATTPNVELAQTVLYRSNIGFQVCARRALHDCTLTFVSSAGLDRGTIRIGPLDIEPADRCEGIGATAAERCGDAGVDPFHELPSGRGHGPTMEWVACAARCGFVYRGGPNTVVVDPRDEDPHALPGHARLQCAEGFKRVAFDNTR